MQCVVCLYATILGLKRILINAIFFCNICYLYILQIVVEEFLEDINNILNSGEVPNLFEKDELEFVMAATRPKAKEAGIAEGNRDEVRGTV